MKVSELTGAQLDHWVARANGGDGRIVKSHSQCNADYFEYKSGTPYRPSTRWAHGGPLMEKYKLSPYTLRDDRWAVAGVNWFVSGDTALEAICRAVVQTVFGEEVAEIEASE